MKELLEKNNVQLYSTETEEMSSVVERWKRTMCVRCGNTLHQTTNYK